MSRLVLHKGTNWLVLQKSGPGPDPDPPGDRQLLSEDDFTYLGWYDLQSFGGNRVYGHGLTCRWVDDEFRLMTLAFRGNTVSPRFALREFTFPENYESNVIVHAAHSDWNDIWGDGFVGNDAHHGIWWDEEHQKLWHTAGQDYTIQPWMSSLNARTIHADGSISGYTGWFGVDGISHRAHFGGVARVPDWFQAEHGVGRLVTGWGGYTSLVTQGLYPSMGPMLVFWDNDPALSGTITGQGFTSPTPNVPSSEVRIGADHRTGNGSTDWFSSGFAARTYDRGVTATVNRTNWFGNDTRQNPSTRPELTDMKPPPRSWQYQDPDEPSPAPGDPDGWGRWMLGDSYYSTGNWIDNNEGTRSRHGILMIASVADGYGWYQTSALRSDSQEYEIHIFDPDDVGAVLNGEASPHLLRPRAAWSITALMPGAKPVSSGGRNASRAACGATFDRIDNKLYIRVNGGLSDMTARVHVFKVN